MTPEIFSATREAIRNLFRSPNTVMFPTEHVDVPETIRGVPKLNPELCSLCQRCERACPTDAIVIEKHSKTEGEFTLDLGKCCYCQECESNCNFGAITLTTEWLTSELTREPLVRHYQVVKGECE